MVAPMLSPAVKISGGRVTMATLYRGLAEERYPYGKPRFPNLDPRAYFDEQTRKDYAQEPWHDGLLDYGLAAAASVGLGGGAPAIGATRELGKSIAAVRLQDVQKAKAALESGQKANMPSYLREDFKNALSPMDKFHYYNSWTPKWAPESPLFSPAFWATATALSSPWAYLAYSTHQGALERGKEQQRARTGIPVLDDQSY